MNQRIAWKGGKDAFGRINLETNNVAHRPAYGRVNGLATVTGTLDGKAIPVTVTGTNWNTLLELTPGTHQLVMEAVHPSGMFTTNKSVWFTNNASDRVEASYSASGVLTNRVWKKASGTTYRTQSLVWDAKGRLTKATERDASNNGRNFAVVYDTLGRRVQTTEIVVTNSLALTNTPIIVSHLFDPLVEFLELGVTENGRTSWKLVGPDFDGIYGGQNGTGGFEADIPSPELFHPTLADAFGNVHAAYDQNHATYQWNDSRLTAYGSVPGYRPLTLGSGGSLVAKSAWRNRPTDAIGYVWMGGNWLDPESGRFLSFDEQGFASGSSGTGYDAFNGNPYGYWDADGHESLMMGSPFDARYNMGNPAYARGFNSPSAGVMTPRIQGGLKMVGGAGEMVVGGVGMAATSPTIVGPVISGAAFLHGADTFQAGVRQVWTGANTPSATATAITYYTGNPAMGEMGDAGLGVVLSLGSGLLTQGPKVGANGGRVTQFYDSTAGAYGPGAEKALSSPVTLGGRVFDGASGVQTWVAPAAATDMNWFQRFMTGVGSRTQYVEFNTVAGELANPGGIKGLLTSPWQQVINGEVGLATRNQFWQELGQNYAQYGFLGEVGSAIGRDISVILSKH